MKSEHYLSSRILSQSNRKHHSPKNIQRELNTLTALYANGDRYNCLPNSEDKESICSAASASTKLLYETQ
ncbi:hypothetical protein DOY81_001638 [Sarcophaga bullata]|nr:hypothetical protein DOY81_001638 [Sarcophaga bullata]